MADYLCPEANMSVTDQKKMFPIRCRANSLGTKRGIIENCETMCGELLVNLHTFKCKILNKNNSDYNFYP